MCYLAAGTLAHDDSVVMAVDEIISVCEYPTLNILPPWARKLWRSKTDELPLTARLFAVRQN